MNYRSQDVNIPIGITDILLAAGYNATKSNNWKTDFEYVFQCIAKVEK
jgi:hypothetical protein